jgi:hypothetical protein
MQQREELVMRTVLAIALGLLFGSCGSGGDDDSIAGDDDSAANADDDTSSADDDDLTWEGEYQIVRICGCDGGDPGNPGPDVDAIEVRRDTTSIGFADLVTASNVPAAGNGHPDPEQSVGEPDGEFVSVGGLGSHLDLTLALAVEGGDLDDTLIPGDLVSIHELDDGSGEMESYRVLVSYDGAPGTWVLAEVATGAWAVAIHEPYSYLEGCEG